MNTSTSGSSPQKGIQYFVAGSSAKLRRGDIDRTGLTASWCDQGLTFMLIEIDGDEMHYQTITDKGQTIDTGMIRKDENTNEVIGTTGTAGRATGAPSTAAPPTPAAKPAQPARR